MKLWRSFGFIFFIVLSFILSLGSACRPDGPKNSEKTTQSDGGGGGTPEGSSKTDGKKVVKSGIPAIQDPSAANHIKKGEAVQLSGVIVTSPIFVAGKTLKGFFVSDPSFPPKFGGIMVVVEKEFSEELNVGDVIDIEGIVDEYYGNTQIKATSTIGGLITKTGENKKDKIKPVVLETKDLPGNVKDKAKPNDSPSEPYEGMLVEFHNVKVEALGDHGVINLAGGVIVDDTLFHLKAKVGDTFKYLRGVVQYSYDAFRVLPRFAADIDGAKPECTKNDDCGTGRKCDTNFGKCVSIKCSADSDCKKGEKCNTNEQRCEKPLQTLTIVDIQDPSSAKHPSKYDPIEVKGVIVTTSIFQASKKLKGFFVADPSFPSKFGGVMVVVDDSFAETLAIGDVVDIKGKMDEYYNNTQIKVSLTAGGEIKKTGQNSKDKIKAISVSDSDIPGTPDAQDPEKSKAEPYEGMLVELKDVTVTQDPDKYGVWKVGKDVVVDDTLFKGGVVPKKGTKLAFLRGVIQYSYNLYRLLPRSKEDIDGAKAGCEKDDDCPNGTCDLKTKRCVPKTTSLTVVDIQDPSSAKHPKKGDPIEVKGVIVTTPIFKASKKLKGFFVADPSFPSKFGGVMVVVDDSYSDTLAVGDVVDIKGKMDEFWYNTQIKVTLTAGGEIKKTGQNKKGDIKPITVTAKDIPAAPKDKKAPDSSVTEPYEGMLVQIKGATVTEEPDKYGVWKIGDVVVDDTIFKYAPKKGDKVDVVGVIQYSYNLYRLLPRSADDIKKN